MELIPILSLIMLVATIATFILAIGAYILYKIRERNNRIESEHKPESVDAELVTPSQFITDTQHSRQAFTGDLDLTQERRRKPLYTNIHTKETRMRPTFVGPIYSKTGARGYSKKSEKITGQNKYLRYTQDGYVEPQKDENKDSILKWR